ncbi:MAG: amino acid adenylation domain-containing protein, partial [Acidobacteriota bacterium]
FHDLLARSRQLALDAFSHQEAPFERLVEVLDAARDTSRTPLFQVMLVLQRPPLDALRLPGVAIEPLPVDTGTAKFDLTLNLIDSERSVPGVPSGAVSPGALGALLEYDRELFDASTIDRWWGHFATLVEAATADPELPLAELPLLSPNERRQLVVDWNATEQPYCLKCLHRPFEASTAAHPDAVALVFENQHLSYRALDASASRLANHLEALGLETQDRVAILMERSLELVTALYAVVKAGGAYVPLDPDYPAERLAFMLRDAAAGVSTPLLLTHRPTRDHCRELVQAADFTFVRQIDLDRDRSAIGLRSSSQPRVPLGLEYAAYMIYTSGSTGRPKGVVNSHRGIANRLCWMQDAFDLTPADRVLQKTPFTFDVSVWEFFWPLAEGAQLVLARPQGHRDPAYLVRLIAERGITTLHFVPSMLQIFVDEPSAEQLESLTRVIASGEALPPDLVERFQSRLGGKGAELHNLYGPTEAAVDVTWWACDALGAERKVPIGRPIANTRVLVLDRHLRPQPVGVAGELHLAGIQLARGYQGRPGLTAERFIPDPFSEIPGHRLYRTGDLTHWSPAGEVEYLGRLDFQVKVRGLRIELGEIEFVLAAHPAVREAVVTAIDGERLVAYLTPDGTPPESSELRRSLAQRLPDHMVPAIFVVLDELPLSVNGKVDRKALPTPEAERTPSRPPSTPLERQVATIWQELLGVERVGADDHFFALGGHSLLATQVVSRLRQRCGIELPVRSLFEAPTVAQLAEAAEAAERERQPLIPQRIDHNANTAGDAGLSYAQERLWLLSRLDPDSTAYHIGGALALAGRLDVAVLATSLAGLIERHEGLRTGFIQLEGRPMQRISDACCADASTILPQVDLEALGVDADRRESQRLLGDLVDRPFRLAAPPLLRAVVIRLGPEDHLFGLVLHHLIADGWSLGILLHELAVLYRSAVSLDDDLGDGVEDATEQPRLAPRSVSYRDFAAWQRQRLEGAETPTQGGAPTSLLERQLAFWRHQLRDLRV